METSGLDYFLPLINTNDPKMKLSVGAKLLEYLSDPSNSIACSDIGFFVDNLVIWLQSSNFKVVQLDLDILIELIDRMTVDFQPYLSTSLPHLVDKLGDGKEIIRSKTISLFFKLIDSDVISVQNLFDRISVMCFTHKNSNVREQIMHFLTKVLNSYGASSLYVSKLVPHIVKLLSDPNVSVRSRAFDTLCDIYKHVGEKFRVDLQKKYSIPNNKLPALMTKFDEIKTRNSFNSLFGSMSINGDETDDRGYQFESMTKSAYRPPITPISSTCGPKRTIRKTAEAGAVTEESFLSSFEDVPSLQLFSSRDVEDNFRKYAAVLEKVNEDWSKRVDCLKKIRSIMVAGGLEYEEFHTNLSLLLPSFLTALKDLRSTVVREACVTIAFLSKSLGNKFDRFAEAMLFSLIHLIQNSAKVTSSSGFVCIRFILRYTHASRLIPIISGCLTSKSKDIRRACCEFIHLILVNWHTMTIERHVNNVQDAIKKGIMDADSEARILSRNAFAEFAHHFPDLADGLKNSLDYSYRKLLLGGSNSGSSSSLSKISVRPTSRTPSNVFCRSSSAIDSQAANRAKIRAHYAALDRQKSIYPKKVVSPTDERSGRTPSRVSISQPTSRSASPSSRLNYAQYLENTVRSRRSSADNDTSRDSSSGRYGFKSHLPVRKPSSAHKIEADIAESCDNPYSRARFKIDEHDILTADKDSTSYDSGISQTSSADQDIKNYDFPDTTKDCNRLKALIEELSEAGDEDVKREVLTKIKSLIQESPSDVIVTHFKLILGKIISFLSESQPVVIKETALLLLHTIVKRKTVTFLLKQFSDLVIIRVIAMCDDSCKDVAKAAENCAITLSTHLPPESVIRVVVPLVTSEATAVKLAAIKMLSRVIECSDENITSSHIDQIMPVLLEAYYDETDSSIRKAAVFAMVALHKQSEEMRILLEPYISKLQGAKLKLFQLYVRRAEQGSSMPTSPRNPF